MLYAHITVCNIALYVQHSSVCQIRESSPGSAKMQCRYLPVKTCVHRPYDAGRGRNVVGLFAHSLSYHAPPPPSTTWYESELLNPMEVGTENDYQYQYPFMHHYVFYQQDLYLFVRAHTHAQTHMYTNTYICINKKDVHSI